MTMVGAVKRFLLEWDPTVFDDDGSGVKRCLQLRSGRVVYQYIPFDIKPGEHIGMLILVSINPDDFSDIRFADRDEFHECNRTSFEIGELEVERRS